jgi:hypothetical protein
MPLSYDQQLQLSIWEEELAKREKIIPPDVLSEALPYQLDFIKDPSLFKLICSERRGGKSFALALALVDMCISRSRAKCIYMSLDNKQCERIMWTDIFETIFVKYKIDAIKTSQYEIKFANGSIIYLHGIDASPNQKNKIRGQAFDLAVIDEAQDFNQDLREIIHNVLAATLAQTKAQLILAGTPGNKQGLHYWFTLNKTDSTETQWKRFKFHWKENVKEDPKSGIRICDAMQSVVDAKMKANPNIVLDPAFRQEFLGEWVIETSARIYRYEPSLNDSNSLPSADFLKTATYVLGFDLGYHPDPTALVIGCFNHKFDDRLYILQSEEHLEMITARLAQRIKELDKEYHFQSIVGDSANLNVISDLNITYGIPTIKADKLGKLAHQNMLNSDFITNNVSLYAPGTQLLSEQLQTVIWDKHGLMLGKHVEDSKYANHCTDALLYLHFYARHHWHTPMKEKAKPSKNSMTENIMKTLLKRNKGTPIDFSDPNRSGDR